MVTMERPLRILLVCQLWQGSDSYAFARALRRLGHSVSVVSEDTYGCRDWRGRILRIARRLLRPLIVAEFNQALMRQAEQLQPHLLLVCKGPLVEAEAIRRIKQGGAVAALWWPDVSFFAHGPYIPRALPQYDWVFTTKTFGLHDLAERFGLRNASFLPHAFHPEVHRKFACDTSDRLRYGCDVSFIGTWSPKKQALLEALVRRRPEVHLKIWGSQWEKASASLARQCTARETTGAEYAKAIRLSKINLGILSEARPGSRSGDLITARTFHIPACGGFMLHERTREVVDYFVEGKECALFADADEMIAKIDYYLDNAGEREALAEAGHIRCLSSGHSVDDRVAVMLAKVEELRGRRPAAEPRRALERSASAI